MIKIGPSGIGPFNSIDETIKFFYNNKIKACEIAFVHSVYLSEKQAEKISQLGEKFDISFSIHASYYINLGSSDLVKRNSSIKRIIDAIKIGHILNGTEKTKIIFHPGYYGENKIESKENIIDSIQRIQSKIKENKWAVVLCPETMGKVNVFGSIEEIKDLVDKTGCSYCLDFAHILARNKNYDWKKVEELFSDKNWHIHFSGINYGEKGEKNHVQTKKEEWEELFRNLNKYNINATIISEAPDPLKDSIDAIKLFRKDFTHS